MQVNPNAVTSNVQASTAAATKSTSTRAVDGDYKVRSAATSQVKDADGDYKPASKSPAQSSSAAVQATLGTLKTGG